MNKLLFTIITFYQFKKINNLSKIKIELNDICKFNKIRGTIIIAKEGINATVAGNSNSIKILESFLKNKGFDNIKPKYSYYKYMPFFRLKIKPKKEIVTFRSTIADPEQFTGKHIKVKDWNDLIKDEKTIVIDVRNNFEFKIGTFERAKNPQTNSFTKFKDYVKKNLNESKEKKIALFCTGGIRCEKASSYMIKQGFKNVNQLNGGILKYLEKIPKNKSLWNGECFVFDNRVSIKNELKEGTFTLCHACRHPVSKKDLNSTKYKKGLSCPRCYGTISNSKKKSLLERNKQIKISKKRGLFNPYIKRTLSEY
tara:strand:+ start:281 stop:1213 length:933 start_codon:yes stop_codon:yes gene_type:complete